MPDPEIPDDLYGVSPDEFVAARNAMVKRLRAAGQRDDAAIVAKLRRPPQSAWAVNRLARTEPDTVDRFFEAASRLADALEDDSSDLRDAQTAFRAAIEDTVSAATEGVGIRDEAMRSRVRNIVLAAGVDPDVAESVRRGTVSDDHDAPGFSLVPGGTPAARRVRPGADTPEERRSRLTVIDGRAGEDDRGARHSVKVERERIKERTRLERQVEKLTATAERAAEQAEEAEAKARVLRDEADRAEAAATAAREELDVL